jgi:hypothetical protein
VETDNFWREPSWWDEEIYEYNNEAIQESVLNKKRRRAQGLVLSEESYSFVTIISRF